MCVIIIKPAGCKPPSLDVLAGAFINNPNGAGVAYVKADKNSVIIKRGYFNFMEFAKMLEGANIGIDDSAIYHFRIATSGKINILNCHPFPIFTQDSPITKRSFNSDSSIICAPIAFAHNGILSGYGSKDGISDTNEFVSNILSPLSSVVTTPPLLKILGQYTSKFAFLSADGGIYTVGTFVSVDDCPGISASNSTYKYTKPVARGYYYRGHYIPGLKVYRLSAKDFIGDAPGECPNCGYLLPMLVPYNNNHYMALINWDVTLLPNSIVTADGMAYLRNINAITLSATSKEREAILWSLGYTGVRWNVLIAALPGAEKMFGLKPSRWKLIRCSECDTFCAANGEHAFSTELFNAPKGA